MKRVAVVNLTGGGLSGGYLKYLKRLIPALAKHPDINLVANFLPPTTSSLSIDGIEGRTWPKPDRWIGYRNLIKQVKDLKPDVVFVPTSAALFGLKIPQVIMVRNMEPIEVPFGGNPFSECVRNIFRYRSTYRACLAADRIIAVSRHVKKVIIEKWHLPEERIGMVYHGVDLPISKYPKPPQLIQMDSGGFLFTAGSIRPARGLEDAFFALSILKAKGIKIKLAIAGAVDPGMGSYYASLVKLARRLNIFDSILWTGSLDAKSIAWAFANCRLFLMTTRAEACPNTALEALSHGCICISTDKAPLPEFLADCAVYYEGGNGKGLAKSIEHALGLENENLELLRVNAQKRAQTFTWERSISQTANQLLLTMRRD